MPQARDPHEETLAALDRLLTRHKLVTPEQAQLAARLITGDENVVFPRPPPPAPPPSPPPAPAPAPASAPEPAPEPAPAPADKSSPEGSEST